MFFLHVYFINLLSFIFTFFVHLFYLFFHIFLMFFNVLFNHSFLFDFISFRFLYLFTVQYFPTGKYLKGLWLKAIPGKTLIRIVFFRLKYA